MYLKYLQIINYKNLQNVRFEFNRGANTLIGENDAGKSNALTALRVLLDSSYYYDTKRLKESDFTNALGDWRGHWIIISAFFDNLTSKDMESEVCNELKPDPVNEDFLKYYIRCEDNDYGTISLFVRPIKSIRKKLFEAESAEEFERIRASIRLTDYEFAYYARTQEDFTNPESYTRIVGDIDNHKYADPDNEDASLLGGKINIIDVWQYIAVSYIDALRDVASEMHKPKNPLKRIFDTLQDQIATDDIESIQGKIRDLNCSLANIRQIANMGESINAKLQDIVGLIYSPNIAVESRLKEDISSISRYLSLVPSGEEDIELLGLGHLNILYIAMKLVEFEANQTHEILNIMLVEEPEAHVHTHIQRTLFDNLGVSENYTQVIMTTHSTHISEVSDIENVNVLKKGEKCSAVMRPTNNLDSFGAENLKLKDLPLSKCLERYLDAKRSVLLFSKGVILVEGDAEEILIPELAKKVLGMSLDEMGIGIINVGSVAFEYIASIFGPERIQRKCAILTDSDAIVTGAKKCKPDAAEKGASRKEKLTRLFGGNSWVKAFYAPHTFEVDLYEEEKNREYYKALVKNHYIQDAAIQRHCKMIDESEAERYDEIITLMDEIGKGWAATVVSELIDGNAVIPDYIIRALAFASSMVITPELKKKMMLHVAENLEEEDLKYSEVQALNCPEKIVDYEQRFIRELPECSLSKYFKYQNEYADEG